MLKVRTYLDRSGVQGIGLFAAERIARGTVVWEYCPGVDLVFEQDQWEDFLGRCAPEVLGQLRRYSYKEGGRYFLCIDNAQFMNHSSEAPNIRSGENIDVILAVRDIEAHEEIFCDYFEYCDPDDYNAVMIRNLPRRISEAAG